MLHASDRSDRWMRQPVTAIAVTFALLTAFVAVGLTQGPASAGGPATLIVSSGDDPTEQRFDFQGTVASDCFSGDEYEVVISSSPGGPDTVDVDVDAEIEVDGSQVSGSFSAADLAAEEYWLQLHCEDLINAEGSFDVLRLTVDKIVEGDVPEGTSFEVEAACEVPENGSPADSFELLLAFGEDGGTTSLLIGPGSTCNVTVTDDGGAESTEVDNGQDLLFGSAAEEQITTVTSTFPEAEESEEAPPVQEEEDEDDEEEPEDDEEEDLDEAEPAEAVEEEPDYTG